MTRSTAIIGSAISPPTLNLMFMLSSLICSSSPPSSSSEPPPPANAEWSFDLPPFPITSSSCFFLASEAAPPSFFPISFVTFPAFFSAFSRFSCCSYAALYSSSFDAKTRSKMA